MESELRKTWETGPQVLSTLLDMMGQNLNMGISTLELLSLGSEPVLAHVIKSGLTATEAHPRIFVWVGAETPRLVMCLEDSLSQWSSTTRGLTSGQRFIPGPWMDVCGNTIEPQMDRCARALLACLHLQPHLSEVRIKIPVHPISTLTFVAERSIQQIATYFQYGRDLQTFRDFGSLPACRKYFVSEQGCVRNARWILADKSQ